MAISSDNYLNVISLGMGKQSTFLLLTALNGCYKYKPDFAVFSDTGCEPKYVYDYLKWLKIYVERRWNFKIVIVSAGNLMVDIVDYVCGEKDRVANLPLRLENEGMIRRQCTYDYKIAPLRKYLQQIRNEKKIRLWIGISIDEMERMKESNVKYIENYYPLIEDRFSIDYIIEWFNRTGFALSGKSACKICPFHSDEYWKRYKKEFPHDFEEICHFDELIRYYPKLLKRAFLSRHLKPLREINFNYEPSLFPELIEECEGLCGI